MHNNKQSLKLNKLPNIRTDHVLDSRLAAAGAAPDPPRETVFHITSAMLQISEKKMFSINIYIDLE